jgi:Uma2 family endonuclease
VSLPKRDDRQHTYADYLSWPEDVRYELIDGEAFLMAGPDLAHQEIVGEVYRQLGNALNGKPCRPFIAPFDVRLPKPGEQDAQASTVVQPDVMVVCDPSKLDRRGVRGAPDLVVEVPTPSTASRDYVLKRRIYERAGVREYWLVHPTDRVLHVYLLGGDGYGKPHTQELTGSTRLGILPDIEITWDELVARLPPVEL